MGVVYTNNYLYVVNIDNSGRWGRGGVFSALSTRSAEPERYYKKAGKMDGERCVCVFKCNVC